MQHRIRRFLDERMHMLAAASHDLRTPITRLRLRAELIEDAEQRSKTLKDLDEMEAVIASTIAYAREETTSEPTTAVDLARLVQEIRNDLQRLGIRSPSRGRSSWSTKAAPRRSKGRSRT